jgi:hypothetical protein
MNTRSKIAVLGMVALSFAFSGNATAQTMKEKTVLENILLKIYLEIFNLHI